MTYCEAIDYLNSFVNYEELTSYDYKTSFKLDRMRLLSELLGDPHKGIRVIHITGTKGKGSTAAIASSILKASSMRTGLYTSPHLLSFRERIKIDGEEIAEGEVADLVEEVGRAVEHSGRKDFTFFELYTAVAFLYFKAKKTDIAVIEVGLGGRLDATNLVEPFVSCITPISLDHTHLLGPALADIAGEKAAIIKRGSVCVSAPQADEVRNIIRSACAARGVTLYEIGRDILYRSSCAKAGKELFEVSGVLREYPRLEMKLLGEHQVMNAATAIGAVEALELHGITISPEAVRKGIADVAWPARLETVQSRPAIVLDGAHNRESVIALKKAIKERFKFNRLILVLGVSSDKDIPAICRELDEIADEVILTKAAIARAQDPRILKKYICNSKTRLTDKVADAVELARRTSGEDDLILITGSFFVLGEAKEALQR